MSSPVDLAQLAARALAKPPAQPSRGSACGEEQTVRAVAVAIRARKRNVLVRRLAAGLAVAAAVALAIGVSRKGAAPVAYTGARAPVAPSPSGELAGPPPQ